MATEKELRSGLTQERLKEVLHYDEDTGVFTWRVSPSNRVKVGEVAGFINPTGYRVISVFGVQYLAHRLAWLYARGEFPTQVIDHLNGVRADNRISNLADKTPRENSQNQRRASANSKTGVLGVCWRAKGERFIAQIRANGKVLHLGRFTTLEQATAVRKAAERLYFPTKPQFEPA